MSARGSAAAGNAMDVSRPRSEQLDPVRDGLSREAALQVAATLERSPPRAVSIVSRSSRPVLWSPVTEVGSARTSAAVVTVTRQARPPQPEAEGGGRPRTNKPPPTKPKPSRRLPLQETDDVGSLTQNAPNSPSTSGRPVARSQTELHQIPTAGAATLRSRGLTSATPGLHCMPPPTLTPHSEVGQRHRTVPSAGHAEAARSPPVPGAHEASNPTPSTDRQPATANSSYLQSIRPSIGLLISALAVEIYDHPDHIGNITKLESLRMRLAIDQEEWERIFTEARELSGGGQASLYVEIVKQTATAWKDKTQGLNVSDAELRAALIKHFIDSGLQGVVARITPELIPDSLHGVAYKVSDIMRKDLRAPNRDSGRAAGDSGIGNSV